MTSEQALQWFSEWLRHISGIATHVVDNGGYVVGTINHDNYCNDQGTGIIAGYNHNPLVKLALLHALVDA